MGPGFLNHVPTLMRSSFRFRVQIPSVPAAVLAHGETAVVTATALLHHGGSSLNYSTVNPIKLETGLRPNSAGIPYTVLLRIEAIGFPTFGLLP